jgi:hypothetical protein
MYVSSSTLVSEPAAFFTLVVTNSYRAAGLTVRLRAGVSSARVPQKRVYSIARLCSTAFFLRSFIGSGPPYSFDAMSERVNPYGFRWIIV